MRMKRYLGRMLWAGTAPLIGLAGLLSTKHILHERALIEQSAEILASQLAESLKQDIDKRVAGLRLLANSPDLDDAQGIGRLHRQARDYHRSFGSHVAVFDTQFSHLMNTRVELGQPLPAIALPRGRSAVTLARASGQPQVGDLVRTQWSSDHMLSVAVPASRNGQVQYLLVTTFEAQSLRRHLDSVPIPQGWRIRVLDSLGDEIALFGPPGGKDAPLPPLRVRYGVGELPWQVEVDILSSAYWGPLMAHGAWLLAGLLMTTALTLGVARRAGRRLNEEIEALAASPLPAHPPSPEPLDEIAMVRQRLIQTAAERDSAETSRRGDEARFRVELEARRRILDTALSSMNDAVWIGDAQGRTQGFNAALVSMHRLKQPPVVGEDFRDWADALAWKTQSGEEVLTEHWPMARALKGLSRSSAQYWLENRLTGERWIGSYSFAPICDAEGRIQGAVVLGRDITALRLMRDELKASRAQLRRQLEAQQHVEERERRRIALELHDDLQQKLAALRIALSAPPRQGVGEGPAALLAEPLAIVDSAIEAIRRIVNDLRPAALDDLGLVAALEDMVSRFGERHGLAFEFEVLGAPYGDLDFSPELAICLFRVAQESLNNVAKHAHAREVRLALDVSQPQCLTLRIDDDGVGPGQRGDGGTDSGPEASGGMGIPGMRERLAAFDGMVRVSPLPGGGTRVTVTVPHAVRASERRE